MRVGQIGGMPSGGTVGRVSRTRQRFVAPVVDAEAAVAQVEAALDDLKVELDRVEGELEGLRTAAEGRE